MILTTDDLAYGNAARYAALKPTLSRICGLKYAGVDERRHGRSAERPNSKLPAVAPAPGVELTAAVEYDCVVAPDGHASDTPILSGKRANEFRENAGKALRIDIGGVTHRVNVYDGEACLHGLAAGLVIPLDP